MGFFSGGCCKSKNPEEGSAFNCWWTIFGQCAASAHMYHIFAVITTIKTGPSPSREGSVLNTNHNGMWFPVCVWFSVNYNTSCWVSWGFFFSSCLKQRLRAMVGDSEAGVAYAYRMPCAILKSNQVEKPCWAYTMRLIACSWAKATSKDCRLPLQSPPCPRLCRIVCAIICTNQIQNVRMLAQTSVSVSVFLGVLLDF